MKPISQILSESLRSYNLVTSRSLVTEADAGKKRELIFQYLRKKIKNFGVGGDNPPISKRTVNGQAVVTYWGVDSSKPDLMLVGFNFDKNGSLYSVDFYHPKDFMAMFPGATSKSALSIFSNGNSAVLLLPVIVEVCDSRKFDLDTDKAKLIAKDEIYGEKSVEEESEQVNEAPRRDAETRDYMDSAWKKKQELHKKYKETGSEEDKINWKKAKKEFDQIYAAYQSGAHTVEEIKMVLERGVEAKTEVPAGLEKAEKEVEEKIEEKIGSDFSSEEKKADDGEPDSGSKSKKKDFLKFDFKIPEGMDEFEYDPMNIFASMEAIVATVADGGTNLALICGAPGLGKSFRIEKLLREIGMKEGENFAIVKGKLGPKALYTTLYKFRDKGQVVFLDDADSALAEKDSRNIIKAACDTTAVGKDDAAEEGGSKGRRISYNIGQRIKDTEGNDIPTEFLYNGGMIIATNWRAGKVESAIRDRALTMELDFDNNQVLKIIYDILDKIDIDGVDVPLEIREETFGILKAIFEDKNAPKMRLSCRAFVTAAKLTNGMRRIPDSEQKRKQLIMTIRSNLVNLASHTIKAF